MVSAFIDPTATETPSTSEAAPDLGGTGGLPPPESPPGSPDGTAIDNTPSIDFSSDWYDRPTPSQTGADESPDGTLDNLPFESVLEKIQSKEEWRERYEEHISEKVRASYEPFIEQARVERATLEESNTKRAEALTKAAEAYQTLAGRIRKLSQEGMADAESITEALSSVPNLAANIKLLSEEFIGKQVEEKLEQERAGANMDGAWSGLVWGLERGLKSVGLARLWSKQKTALESVKTWDDVEKAVGSVYKSALEAAYKRGVSDARQGGTEVRKMAERAAQGPNASTGGPGRFKTDDDVLALSSGASSEEVRAAYKRKYGIDPPI